MTQAQSINWADFGITLSIESVQKQAGPHASDRRVITDNAIIPTVVDVEKFVEAFGPQTLLRFINGTSLRVRAQSVARQMAKEKDTDKIEQALLNSIKAVRNVGVRSVTTITVNVHDLPDGTKYTGSDLVEYQQLYTAALMDAGVDSEVALNIAKMQTI